MATRSRAVGIAGALLIAGGAFARVGLLVLALAFVGILSPIVLLPAEVFGPAGPTLTGQYIFKNIVLIAAALAKGADVFVMDEPTAGVDVEQQGALAEVFRAIRDGGGTVLLVTHELGPFRDLATRVVVLDHGRITYDGPPPGPVRHDHVWHHSEDVAVPPRPGPLDGGAGVHEP